VLGTITSDECLQHRPVAAAISHSRSEAEPAVTQ